MYSNNKPPMFDGLYQPFMVIRGMVYYCYTNITIFKGQKRQQKPWPSKRWDLQRFGRPKPRNPARPSPWDICFSLPLGRSAVDRNISTLWKHVEISPQLMAIWCNMMKCIQDLFRDTLFSKLVVWCNSGADGQRYQYSRIDVWCQKGLWWALKVGKPLMLV